MDLVWRQDEQQSAVFVVRGKNVGHRLGRKIAIRVDRHLLAKRADTPFEGCLDRVRLAVVVRIGLLSPVPLVDPLEPEDLLAMATVNGAQALGWSDRVGSLERGKLADLVIRRHDLPEAQPALDPIRAIAFATTIRRAGGP